MSDGHGVKSKKKKKYFYAQQQKMMNAVFLLWPVFTFSTDQQAHSHTLILRRRKQHKKARAKHLH